MNTTRHQTLFAMRYAVRVLERNARMWSVLSTAFKFVSILSGTVALAALTGEKTMLAIWLGVVFAVFQALDHALDPSGKKAASLTRRRDYARLLAAQTEHDDIAIEAAYQAILADDDITVIQPLKELAYNDVVREQGLAAEGCYPDHRLLRVLS